MPVGHAEIRAFYLAKIRFIIGILNALTERYPDGTLWIRARGQMHRLLSDPHLGQVSIYLEQILDFVAARQCAQGAHNP
jgi:hypothetical protein